jgi:hypothetical protein
LARAQLEAALTQEERPAVAAERETEVEDDERREDEGRIGLEDQRRDLGQPLAVEVEEEADDRKRDDDREDRPRLTQPARE